MLLRITLIIILTRAGLSLDLNDLRKVGRPAILMSFLPACSEIAGASADETIEDKWGKLIPFASLIAVMAIGIALQKKRACVAKRLSVKFNKLWVGAEVMLFVLVGATVDIKYALSSGVSAVILIFGVLAFRMVGVCLCLIKTRFSRKERLFCMIAYTPKATVQAAIGGVPLAMGLACGEIVLTVAVVAILITAPLGAFFIDLTYKRLLG